MVHNMDHDFSLDDMDLGSLEDFGSLETIDELNFQNLNTHQHIFNENKCDSQQTVDAESTQVRQGEVAMLRERLSKFEMDRHEMVLKNSMRIETLEKEHQKKIKELHEQLERLSTIQAFDSNRQFDSLKTIPNHIRSQLYDSENFNSHLPPRTVNDPRLDSMKDFSPLKGIAKTQNKSAECQSEDFGTENSIINASYHRESYITRSHTIVPDLLPMQTISCERHQSTTVAKPSSNSRNKFYNESENLTPDHHQKILCNHSNSMKFITTTSASPTKMLFISIGYADQVWLKRDVTDGDRLAASKRRQSLIENLTETSNPLMSLKYTLETICGSKKVCFFFYLIHS